MSDLKEQADAVDSREFFVRLVRALLSELESGEAEWENTDLASFLDAAAAWTEDMDGYYSNQGEPVPDPDWRAFARILVAATIYE